MDTKKIERLLWVVVILFGILVLHELYPYQVISTADGVYRVNQYTGVTKSLVRKPITVP